MGSQTLEILRQGVWASVTGGWFYDPHQDVFCNTFHLYIWLFLLCFPFTIYVYFPPTKYVWYFYCVFISIGFTLLKLLNYALHYMYDTSECFKEEAPEEDPKRDDEGIEMQVLGKKNVQKEGGPRHHGSLASYIETGLRNSTDLDSLGSTEFQPLDSAAKPSSTIDLKAEVHRKNSSESSEEPLGVIELVSYRSESDKNHKTKRNDRRKHQRSKTDSFVNITYGNERQQRDSINRKRKRDPPVLIRGVDLHETSFHNRPSFQRSIEIAPDEKASKPQRRHSNFTNSSLNYLPSTSSGANIKQTGSLELTYIDKVPNNIIAGDGFYFENLRSGVRRIRSTALETCCSASSGLTVHPNSLEIIGCKSRNPLPPPSSTLIRNPHFNLCPYYGSEIVYPIAEQSDEHQTSHGPDTDIESLPRQSDSDSDFYENPKYPSRKQKPSRFSKIKKNSDKLSASSKDALLINSNSSDINQKNDFLDDTTLSENINKENNNSLTERTLSNISMDYDSKNCDNSDLKHKCENNNTSESVKPKNKKGKRKKSSESQSDIANCSSLVELDLDWLFDDSCHLTHRKEPLKRDTDWSSTTSVSLEHDVSKVLQETVPVTRSLGAIPKKSRFTNSPNEASSSKTPKSESEKCAMCRCKSEKLQNSKEKLMNNKENKVTQTLLDEPSSPEGLECLVLPPKIQALNISKKYLKPIKTPEEASSSSSNNELSTLLPEIIPTSNPLLSAFLTSRRFEAPLAVCLPVSRECLEDFESSCSRSRLKRGRARRRPSRRNKRDSAIATSLSQGHGTHFAKNFNDTTDGALHCFQDEQGNWITYTFDEKGIGTANFRQPAVLEQISTEKNTTRRRLSAQNDSILRPNNKNIEIWDLTSTDSINTSAISVAQNENIRSNSDNNVTQTPIQNNNMLMNLSETVRRRILQENAGFEVVHLDTLSALDPTRRFAPIKTIQTTPELNNNVPKIKTFYKFKILPYSFVKISLDRLKLLALLDRNLSLFETLLASFLGILVSILGSIMLFQGFYEDFEAFLFCFVIASSQYSLLKSVQPDSASPIHGFNRVILYSRPVYFCLLTVLVLVLHSQVDLSVKEHFYAFEQTFFDSQLVIFGLRNVLVKIILFFPLLFSLGLFPQVNTFLMFLLEHIDIHIFGGNAQQSLIGSFYCIFRSLLATLILIGFSYGGLSEAKSSQHILFSIFCSILVSSSYHLSRSSSDPSFFWATFKKHLWPPDLYKEHSDLKLDKSEIKNEKVVLNEKTEDQEKPKENQRTELVDPLPHKLQKTVNARLKNDIILCGLISIFVFVIHVSTVFTVLQPELSPVLWSIASIFGFIVHYIIPQLRKQLPWLCIARPVLKSSEFGHYQTRGAAKIMWFERVYVYLCFIERNILYPLVFLSALTEDAPKIVKNFGLPLGSLFVVISGLKCLRGSYSTQNCQYLILTFTALFLKFDYGIFHEEQTFLMEYFILSIVFYKLQELRLKVQFVVTYIAPWQITWGSAFHAFAQPFSVPHSAMLFLQAFISAILSTPLNPFLGSAIFLTSYVRPIKFWEKNYNTRRVDHSNTPLSSHLDRNLGSDDNNLNSIFYEHLTRSLQHSLCGDLILGRWGLVNQGDCFVLASDYLNCLVHVIEMGNGLVTFQMRGLEFRGTYCQQREVEAITEGVEENHGFCCCDFGHLPNMLSVNAAFSQRWLAWEVTASKYILEGYSISDNSAVSMFQVFEFRRILVSYYVKSIIFYTCRSPKLEEWLNSQTILKALVPMQDKTFVDLDPVFNYNIDEDFDGQSCGITKTSFWHIYGDWISFCATKSEKTVDSTSTSTLGLLCFALSLLGRRTLGAVSHNTVSSVEFFLYGLHALFKGDFRITCGRDEWIFTDMDLLKNVVAPGVRMSLKLHQDHFMSADEYEDLSALYDAISKHEQELVISHEGDPAWRNAVLSGTPSLLALRHVMDDGTDEYKIIMLNKRYLSFRVIKLNKECVRGLWAGQQQELIYLRNRNPERGSIQNAKQCLRNIINSSCDQPIGYPIYVSPLTTSYSDTNEQYCQLVGGSVSLKKIKNYIFDTFRRIRKRCGEGCSSGASTREEIQMGHEGIYAMTPVTTLGHHNTGSQSTEGSHLGGSIGRGSSLSRTSLGGNRGSMVSMGKPTSSTLASLAGLFKEKDERNISQTPDAPSRNDERLGEYSEFSPDNLQKVVIIEPGLVYDGINLGRRIDVYWPSEYMKIRGGRSYWNTWVPETGMEGFVVHKWTPGHRDPSKRSHVDRTILLVQIEDKFIPIAEQGVQGISADL